MPEVTDDERTDCAHGVPFAERCYACHPTERPLALLPLTPGGVRQLLRECVTVVKPGETLVVRVPWDTLPQQVGELQRVACEIAEWHEMDLKVLVLPGDELAVAEPEPGGIPGAA